MSDFYYRLKKWRQLRKNQDTISKPGEENVQSSNEIINPATENNSITGELSGSQKYFNDCYSNSDSDEKDNSDSACDTVRDNVFDSESDNASDNACDNINNAPHNSIPLNPEEVVLRNTLREKLRFWSLDNLNILTGYE